MRASIRIAWLMTALALVVAPLADAGDTECFDYVVAVGLLDIWDGGSCMTVSFELATVSVYYPVLWGVSGPQAEVSAGLSGGHSWQYSGGQSRAMPIVRLYTEAAANLQCGVSCFRVYGGIGARGEFGIEPYGSDPYNALELYGTLTLGPQAGAEAFCWTVWSWNQTLYTGKAVFDVYRIPSGSGGSGSGGGSGGGGGGTVVLY